MLAPHQHEFRDLVLSGKPWILLGDGTGTGKTRTALNAVKEFSGDILVIAPKTTVSKKQWQYEAGVLGIAPPVVISKETFRRDHVKLPRYKAVIIDECHHVLGVTPYTRSRKKVEIPKASQLYEATLWYIRKHIPDRLILASATPNKSPMAIFAAATILGRNVDFYQFRRMFYTSFSMDRGRHSIQVWTPKKDQKHIDLLADLTHRLGRVLRLADIKDVPEQTFRTETFELTAEQERALKSLPSRFTDSGSLRGKRHQVENGILYEDVFNPSTSRVEKRVERFDCAKIDYILERAIEFPKMVIFANYTEQVDAIAEALLKEGKTVFKLTGATKDRKAIEVAAEAATSAYIVAQASVSSEWEFKSAPCMIFASMSNRCLDRIQGLGRIQRYDAIKKNIYITLVTDYKNSIDKRWVDCIESGVDFHEALFE